MESWSYQFMLLARELMYNAMIILVADRSTIGDDITCSMRITETVPKLERSLIGRYANDINHCFGSTVLADKMWYYAAHDDFIYTPDVKIRRTRFRL